MIKRMLIALTIIAGLSGCNNKDDEIKEKAEKVAVEFIKKEDNMTYVVEGSEFTSAIGRGTVFVHGYCKEDPDTKMSVAVHYGDGDSDSDYEVGSIGYDRKKD
ncbi:hypothetical protein [Bacillus massilinigeriensis]|uniref:hypothetical protein n=1 Tax=Bacillus mediterraneensis TaxID=1805474 RepID=UPI0008F8C07B|nr:hypothetical protein [Bacillus mediterraneensis]